MSLLLFIEQVLNGLQFGVMLFLMAAGLTLIFGVMGLINLAHGSLYMVGAFAAAAFSSPVRAAAVSRAWACPSAERDGSEASWPSRAQVARQRSLLAKSKRAPWRTRKTVVRRALCS